ncbi:methyl-accepting chemotaxis protein [Tepidibacter hydrothermalis]|uniref:Methyl-accepting chemotaxis protein n=1 Tax=Tepidibacter hydrothermalis TaxID=3036126 RepID=A0ABY8EFX3_9FIRM|nr:methyl-accepting chemotaxis protein [Tepidibacter hydrothermalis]WFD10750.1 methyl-accepting chemotaxis protein [Tepidibacter hydrothermalis]
MKLTIKTKLIAIILVVIIVPISILGTTSYLKAKKELKNQFKHSVEQLNNDIKQSIENYFEGHEYGVDLVSNNINLKEIVNHPEYEPFLMSLFTQYVESYKGVTQIYMGTIDGGFRIYPEADMGSDYDPRVRPWYKEAIEEQSVTWTDPYVDVVSGNLAISSAAPVYDNGGKLVGVVGVTISLDELSEKISSIKVGEQGYPYILSSDGTLITHKNPEKIGQKTSVPAILEGINSNKDFGITEYKYKESNGNVSEKLAVYTKMQDSGWYIVSTIYIDELAESTKGILTNAIFIGLFIIIAASLVGIIFANKISNPIKSIVGNMNKVKDGDFTVKSDIKSNDEIGLLSDNFNIMIENVKTLLLDAKQVSSEVSDAATNLAATSEETSASAEEIAKTVEEIAKGASEQAADAENGAKLASNLDDKFNKLANNTDTMSKNASEAININIEGVNVVNELKEKTDLNNKSIQKIESAVRQLNENSSNIEDILDTIRSIADQTNLLALNASIEAARAGEAGKGFAVVADEIRKLAEGSSTATDEIKKIVDTIKEESENTVDIMTEVKMISIDQTKSVKDVNDSFGKISTSIDNITNEIEEVNKFVLDIIHDKDLIVESIGNISAVSEETAAGSEEVTASVHQQAMAVEEVAKSAEKLNEFSLNLNNQIDKFKI